MAEIYGRYNRQEIIEGWDQEKLTKTRAVIVGADVLANFTAIALASVGIGNIEIYSNKKVDKENKKEFLYFSAKEGMPKVQALEQILHQINSSIRAKGMNMSLEQSPLISILGKPDVIIDATNSSKSKNSILEYAKNKGIKVISASADESGAEMHIVNPGDDYLGAKLEKYFGKEQGVIASEVLGGMITEELRKIAMPIGKQDLLVKKILYSLAAPNRFSAEAGKLSENYADLSGKKITIIGAGGLGNPAGLGAALAGIGNIDILDFDETDATNLNRQMLLYDAVGRKKAEALAEKLSQIMPEAKIMGIVAKLNENSDYFEKNRPDAILDCVDSFAVRAVINYFAVKHGIPLISGGTNPRSGQVVVYKPEYSSCLDCRLDVETALAQQRKAAPCRFAPDPSVVMTNQIVAGMMVGEAVKVLDSGHGDPVKKILKYDSNAPRRGGLIGLEDQCNCVKPASVEEWLKEVDKKLPEKTGEK